MTRRTEKKYAFHGCVALAGALLLPSTSNARESVVPPAAPAIAGTVAKANLPRLTVAPTSPKRTCCFADTSAGLASILF